jgi:hypothetical protein
MKTIFSLVVAVLCLTASLSTSAQKKEVPKEMLAKWSFVLQNPQTGDSYDGICSIEQNKEETKAIFTFGGEDSGTTPFRPNDNGKFYADLELQGYSMGVSFDLQEGKLICVLDGGSWSFPLEMTKVD